MQFDRDVECCRVFFSRRFRHNATELPEFNVDFEKTHSLDAELKASGCSDEDLQAFTNVSWKD